MTACRPFAAVRGAGVLNSLQQLAFQLSKDFRVGSVGCSRLHVKSLENALSKADMQIFHEKKALSSIVLVNSKRWSLALRGTCASIATEKFRPVSFLSIPCRLNASPEVSFGAVLARRGLACA